MKTFSLLTTFLLFFCYINTIANGETIYSKLDTTSKIILVGESDSLKTSDSLKVFNKHKTAKIVKLSILSILAAASGYGSLLFGLEANGYPMLFLGLLSIGFIFSIFRIKKQKLQTYEELKKKESEPIIKKYSKYNRSWNFTFYIGLIGFLLTIISFLNGVSLGFLFLILFLSSVLFFVLGFKGKYDSPKQFRKKLFLGFFGLLLHWLPIFLLLALLSGRGE